MEEFNLTQMVKEPTRENNILDIVLTSSPGLIDTEVRPGMSDHKIVTCDVMAKLKQKPNKCTSQCSSFQQR